MDNTPPECSVNQDNKFITKRFINAISSDSKGIFMTTKKSKHNLTGGNIMDKSSPCYYYFAID